MKVFLISLQFILALFISGSAYAQAVQITDLKSVWLSKMWEAKWITCPEVPQRDYGVFHFRKDFTLSEKPKQFKIHVSADNRYRLFVNGTAVVSGPARGTLHHWYFESIDIAQYLHDGKNVIAAIVWNMGTHAPIAQITAQTGLVIQGESKMEAVVNTDETYRVFKNLSYKACSTDNMERLNAYIVVGPGDEVDAKIYPWGWENVNYDTANWKHAQVLMNAVPEGVGTDNIWTIKSRNIPLMEERVDRLSQVRFADGIDKSIFQTLLSGKKSVVIPKKTKIKVLFDQSYINLGYPELITTKGKGSSIKMSYAEALFDQQMNKGNRNDVEGKSLIGNYDIFKPDGGNKRLFRPLWLRTYRYIQLEIETAEEDLILDDLYGSCATYPFEQKATFVSNDATLSNIWDVSWRTARLCAGETYFDCPYYEQLQYPGDTRIQALISLYVSGDDRLMRKSLLDFYYSIVPDGMTQGRYPSSRLQIIPTYSLWWVSMIHDYHMHRTDDVFIEEFLPAIANILTWFEKRIDKQSGMLGAIDWWPFVDYTTGFKSGVPSTSKNGNSSIYTLHYAYTLNQAADLFDSFGKVDQAKKYRALATSISANTYKSCYDSSKNLMADSPDKNAYSQHASILAILTNTLSVDQSKIVMQNVLTNPELIPVTLYFRFYLNRALLETNMGNVYYSQLGEWRKMLDIGLTTFAETPEPSRSDCHAWSASPSYDFLSIIAGIRSESAGFKKVLIQPNLGELKNIDVAMPHPQGLIKVAVEKKPGNKVVGQVIIPKNIEANFIWNDKIVKLQAGVNDINL